MNQRRQAAAVVLFGLLFAFGASAQEDGAKPDYEAKWGQLTIHRLTDEARQAIEAMDDKADLRVVVPEGATQEHLAAICELKWLTKLKVQIKADQVVSLEPLAKRPGLREVYFTGTASNQHASDLSPLKDLKALKTFDAHAVRVSNVDALSNKPDLTRVNLYMAGVDSLAFLKTSPNVEELDLYGFAHTFADYEPVAKLAKLKTLNIYMNKQATDEKLAALESLTSLEKIRMSNCSEVTTLSFLANCVGMKHIHAKWCGKLADISALKAMTHLETLDIEDTAVADITALAGMTKLRRLDISETAVKDLSPLSRCTALQSLKINETQVTDLTPILKLPKLSRLEVSATVGQEQIDAFKQARPDARVDVKE